MGVRLSGSAGWGSVDLRGGGKTTLNLKVFLKRLCGQGLYLASAHHTLCSYIENGLQ